VVGMRVRRMESEAGDLRSSAMEDLLVVRRSEEAVAEGRSMRRTEAPYVARRRPQNGPRRGRESQRFAMEGQ
jgi:hypothetical protein